ncbi:hypothetical protein DTG00_17500 [Salmonella enterica subsp. enterica]|nr:hypothetical protein LFZ28_20880 [Salmonella enterica subsp. enterica serovar Milwaukee str. SA19950795]EBI3670423.1 hypothetical protein [Salmonella enterica]EBX9172726.1 hypothetical protein [Salmonella enterica subsp. enterica serovar Kandla]MJY57305.1 hypothetical protein [Salmonella enterica subsp. enterica serovar Milwaukee]EBX9804352.1 hypothetical protein [Salmonella enterica subsp. enterica serovar Kandla]
MYIRAFFCLYAPRLLLNASYPLICWYFVLLINKLMLISRFAYAHFKKKCNVMTLTIAFLDAVN